MWKIFHLLEAAKCAPWATFERHGSYVEPNLAARWLIEKGRRIEIVDNLRDLTSREEEIFALVSRGMSNKEVARCRKCAERSVKHHMTSIMRKLHVRNRVEAVLKFHRRTSGREDQAGGANDAA